MSCPSIKVSVVVPVYNAEKYLRQAILSISRQTLREIEILCVDDGSTDSSVDILNELAKEDKRIKVLHNPRKGAGAALARNFGLEHASGEYLSILDADDWFEPEMLARSYQRAKETGADVVMFDAKYYSDITGQEVHADWVLNKDLLPDNDVFSPTECADKLFQITAGQAWNRLYRRKFIEQNKIRFVPVHYTDDQAFSFVSLACANKIAILPQKFVNYRWISTDNQNSHKGEWPDAAYLASDAVYEGLKAHGLETVFASTLLEVAAATASDIMQRMTNPAKYSEAFYLLRYHYFEKWGYGRHEISDDYLATWVKTLMKSQSAMEFLLKLQTVHTSNYDTPGQILTQENTSGKKAALYGAGVMGKNLFARNLQEHWVNIVKWVDRDYQKIGFPVENIDNLAPDGNFDFVIVAIEKKRIFEQIKEFLQGKGFEDRRIIWIPRA